MAERRREALNPNDIYELQKLVWLQLEKHKQQIALLEKGTHHQEYLTKEKTELEKLSRLYEKLEIALHNGGI